MKLKLLKIARFFHLISERRYNLKFEIEIVKRSQLFDDKWYLEQYPDVATHKKEMSAAGHYVKYGWKEGRNPSLLFNTKDYLNINQDVKGANVCPLYHYEMFGKYEGRQLVEKTIPQINVISNKKEYKKIKEGIIDIETIKKIISSKDVKVISFDIFDTLLLRPVIEPTDIFYLADKKIKDQHGLEFLKYRMTAESELNVVNANIDDIYNFIKEKYNLLNDEVELMKKEELECEQQFLSKRDDIYTIYQYAVKLNKRIIATSDMYLSSDFLKEILVQNGYDHIDEVYVSNEYKARKDTGDLYDVIIENEKTSNIVHIGDNYNSDYIKALEKNITPIYYPSIKNIVFSDGSIYNVFINNISPDPMCRILIGFTINEYFKDLTKVKNQPALYADFASMIKLSIAPVIFHIASSIATNENIQKNYNQILFASRDGFLPKLGYDIIAKYIKVKPSKYVYAGRRAYYSCQYASFFDYLHNCLVYEQQKYTIENLLNAYIFDKELKDKILLSLSDNESQLDFVKEKQKIISVLCRYKNELDEYYKKHSNESKKYYNSICSGSDKEIIFDCGYSGSISQSLSNITGKIFDKIYLWEECKNKQSDEKTGSKTFLLMNEDRFFISHHLIYEELFSPPEGGCLGFKNNIPIMEESKYFSQMIEEYESIKTETSKYMNNICKMFGSYLQYMKITDTCALQSIMVHSVQCSPYNEISLLDNIKFPDTVFTSYVESLAYKVQKYLNWENPFVQTGFENPNNKIKAPACLINNSLKIGIHIHLYYVSLGYEFLEYLKDFPQKFDLIVTICDNQKLNIVKNIFSETIPNLNKLIIKVVENKGRDVAPWLIGTKEEQNKYDLFCHVQSKVSKHIGCGDEWRHHLLNNLLNKDAVINIFNLFSLDEKLGCVFPKVFPKLKDLCISNRVSQMGEFGEEHMINDLIERMGFEYLVGRKDLFFSEGTMMWYRPKALQPLFDLNLELEEFPPEPIGVGGTIAHAIERLPALVCRLNAYEAKEFTYYEN